MEDGWEGDEERLHGSLLLECNFEVERDHHVILRGNEAIA